MKKLLGLSAVMLCAVIALPAWSQHTKDSLDTVKKAVAEKKALIVDVREKSEWDAGHLAGAKLLPLSALKENPTSVDVKGLPKDKPIYLHCGSGKRCLVAAEILKKQGYDARALKEGYQDLVKSGFKKDEK